jgi:AcrR family transcriptional regulator
MGRRYDHSREELRRLILDAARDIVVAEGAKALTARAVARRVGYAVGTLYTQFENIDDLVLHLNGETLAALGARLNVDASLAPADRLQEMARAYLEFAKSGRALWQLLFDYSFTTGRDLPEWFMAGIEGLIARAGSAIRDLRPDLSPEDAGELAFALFASVHGTCLMLVGRGYRAFARFEAERTVARLVETFIAGLRRDPGPTDAR